MTDAPQSPQPPATPRKSSCRWTRVLLFVSLAANLLVVGAVVGIIANGGPPRVNPSADSTVLFLRALEAEDRRAMLKKLREAGQGPVSAHRDARAQFRAMVTAIRAEPFDPAAVERVLAAQSQLAETRRTLGQGVFIDRITQMTPDERAAFAARLEEVLKKRRKPPSDRDKDRVKDGD